MNTFTLIYLLFPTGLDRKIKKNIKNNKYTIQELKLVRKEVENKFLNMKKGLRRATIICLFSFIIIYILTLYSFKFKEQNIELIFFITTIIFAVIILILFYMHFVYVPFIKKQFNKYIELYYRNDLELLYID